MRIGFAYFTEEYSDLTAPLNNAGLVYSAANNYLFLSSAQYKALEAAYDIEYDKLINYLNKNNDEYRFRVNLLCMLIDGIKESDTNSKEFKYLYELLHSDVARINTFIVGVPGMKVLIKPQATFFVVIDASEIMGNYLGNHQIKNTIELNQALHTICNLEVLPAERMLCQHMHIFRFSVSYPDSLSVSGRVMIIEAVSRLHYFVKLLRSTPILQQQVNLTNNEITAFKINETKSVDIDSNNEAKRSETTEIQKQLSSVTISPRSSYFQQSIENDTSPVRTNNNFLLNDKKTHITHNI